MNAGVTAKFSICDLHFELIVDAMFVPCEYLMYKVRRGYTEKLLRIRCVDSFKPCGPWSSLDLVHFVWETFAPYFLNHAINVRPG
jgi:hypothetical protein